MMKVLMWVGYAVQVALIITLAVMIIRTVG
jgi:hypothetical protein